MKVIRKNSGKNETVYYRSITFRDISGWRICIQIISIKTNNQTYDNLISVVDSTSYEDKIDSYINAIKLYPKRPEAYIKMLEVYTEHGFGIEESKQFMNYYNQNFSENNDNTYDKTSGQIAEMNYQAGIIYLYMYDSDENSQETFRSRALKAYPFLRRYVKIMMVHMQIIRWLKATMWCAIFTKIM